MEVCNLEKKVEKKLTPQVESCEKISESLTVISDSDFFLNIQLKNNFLLNDSCTRIDYALH